MTPDIFHHLYRSITIGTANSVEIIPAGELSSQEALAIYQSGYRARLTESLMEKYETVGRFLGDEKFIEICDNFINSHNSLNANINQYGDTFPQHLESSSQLAEWPFLSDLARLDLQRFQLFHQPSTVGIQTEELVTQICNFAENDFRMKLVENLSFLESDYPLYDLWQAIYNSCEFPNMTSKEKDTLLFWKRGSQVYFKPLKEPLSTGLLKIHSGFPVLASLGFMQESEISEIFQFLGAEKLVSHVKSLAFDPASR